MSCLLSTVPVTRGSAFIASDSMTSQSHSLGPVFLGRQRHGAVFRNFLNVPWTEHTWACLLWKETLSRSHTAQLDWRPTSRISFVIRSMGTSGSAGLLNSLRTSFQIMEHLRMVSSVRFCKPDRWWRHDPELVPTSREAV